MVTARAPAASRSGFAWSKRQVSRPEDAISGEGILPATRYAVQAYVDFVSTRPFLEAVASSLTELFSGKLIALRIDALRKHYPWLSSGLDYFTGRLTQAPEDADFALAWVVKHARTREEQDKAHAALRAKCDILWAQLDALYFAYVNPGWPPPGAFKPIGSSQEGKRDARLISTAVRASPWAAASMKRASNRAFCTCRSVRCD